MSKKRFNVWKQRIYRLCSIPYYTYLKNLNHYHIFYECFNESPSQNEIEMTRKKYPMYTDEQVFAIASLEKKVETNYILLSKYTDLDYHFINPPTIDIIYLIFREAIQQFFKDQFLACCTIDEVEKLVGFYEEYFEIVRCNSINNSKLNEEQNKQGRILSIKPYLFLTYQNLKFKNHQKIKKQ